MAAFIVVLALVALITAFISVGAVFTYKILLLDKAGWDPKKLPGAKKVYSPLARRTAKRVREILNEASDHGRVSREFLKMECYNLDLSNRERSIEEQLIQEAKRAAQEAGLTLEEALALSE
jgi:hypothetical protein